MKQGGISKKERQASLLDRIKTDPFLTDEELGILQCEHTDYKA